MLGYVIAFMAGGLFGIVGMAALACYAKKELMLCNRFLTARLDLLEEDPKRGIYSPVEDPRPHVHTLVN